MSLQAVQVRRFVASRGTRPGRGASRVVAVGSGRGGTGTSLVAGLLAARATAAGHRTLLVDADPLVGSQHLLWGVGEGPGVAAMRGGVIEPEELPVAVSSRLSIATLSVGGPDTTEAESRTLLRRIAVLFPSWDAVVVDAGSRRSSLRICRDLGVRTLLVVGQADPVGIATTHAFLKAAALDAPAIETPVLLNRTAAHEAERGTEVLREGVERFLDRPLRIAGSLPADTRLAAAMADGATLPGAFADSPLQGLADALLTQLLATVADR